MQISCSFLSPDANQLIISESRCRKICYTVQNKKYSQRIPKILVGDFSGVLQQMLTKYSRGYPMLSEIVKKCSKTKTIPWTIYI